MYSRDQRTSWCSLQFFVSLHNVIMNVRVLTYLLWFETGITNDVGEIRWMCFILSFTRYHRFGTFASKYLHWILYFSSEVGKRKDSVQEFSFTPIFLYRIFICALTTCNSLCYHLNKKDCSYCLQLRYSIIFRLFCRRDLHIIYSRILMISQDPIGAMPFPFSCWCLDIKH